VATDLRGLESSDALRAWGGTQSCRDGPIHLVARNAKLLQCDVAIDWQEGALFGFCQNIKKQGLPPVLADSIDRCCQRGEDSHVWTSVFPSTRRFVTENL
jgi:hypothetical protein